MYGSGGSNRQKTEKASHSERINGQSREHKTQFSALINHAGWKFNTVSLLLAHKRLQALLAFCLSFLPLSLFVSLSLLACAA